MPRSTPEPEAALEPTSAQRPQILAYGVGDHPLELTEIRTVEISIRPTSSTEASDADEGTWTVARYPSSARKRSRTLVPDWMMITGANQQVADQVEALIQGAHRAGHTIRISAGDSDFVVSPAAQLAFQVAGDNPAATTEVITHRT